MYSKNVFEQSKNTSLYTSIDQKLNGCETTTYYVAVSTGTELLLRLLISQLLPIPVYCVTPSINNQMSIKKITIQKLSLQG